MSKVKGRAAFQFVFILDHQIKLGQCPGEVQQHVRSQSSVEKYKF
jgi:hypothetical protein